MSSRNSILNAIRRNKPAPAMAPAININGTATDVLQQFIVTLESIGGVAKQVDHMEALQANLAGSFAPGATVVHTVAALGQANSSINAFTSAASLAHIDIACLEGGCGVAENGAIWIDETNMPNRLLPFICQRLVLVLKAGNLVATMHDAYNRINMHQTGYGVFIAGPSKTADIEQSLVIGAHGARSLLVYLVMN